MSARVVRAALVVVAAAAVGTVASAQSPENSRVESFLRGLPAIAHAAPDAASLERAVRARAPSPEVSVTVQAGSTPSLRIAFATPQPVARVVALLAVSQAYAISGDVHQQEWYVATRTAAVPDPDNTRIATRVPVVGRWQLRAELTGRPAGPLPRLVAGASPAYDLTHYTATVTAIVIDRATP